MTGRPFAAHVPIVVHRDDGVWPGRYLRPCPGRPGWSWVEVPGAGEVTDVFLWADDRISVLEVEPS